MVETSGNSDTGWADGVASSFDVKNSYNRRTEAEDGKRGTQIVFRVTRAVLPGEYLLLNDDKDEQQTAISIQGALFILPVK